MSFFTYAPAIAKGALGAAQLFSKVKRQDTTTPAEAEALQLSRQRAAAQLPGYARQLGLLRQVQAATLQNAALGGGSASDVLAAGAASERSRQLAVAGLGAQYEQYRDGATRQLQAQLAAKGAHELRDTERQLQGQALATGAGIQNLNNALTEAATVRAYDEATQSGGPSATPGAPFGPYGGSYYSDPNPNPYYRRPRRAYGYS